MFLHSGSSRLDGHHILSENRFSSDHAPLSIEIPIIEEVIQSLKFTILPKSNQGKAFIDEVISNFKSLNTSNIDDIVKLDFVVNRLGCIINQAWKNNAKKSRISKHSKQWWSDKCSRALNNYRNSRSLGKLEEFHESRQKHQKIIF